VEGYSNLEYDVAAGRRGKRDVHAASLLERLVGAGAIAVNNNAAAVFLALHELAAAGEAIVSRGELIEIGDGFRIPDIMAHSGATLREVGATNRTRIDDYRAAINPRTRLLMRVHPSNFRISGFTARPELHELTALGRERGIPVYQDLGSGCVVDLRAFGIDEPLVSDSLSAGVDLVSFSGDKLLGGPQAKLAAGTSSRDCGAIRCFARSVSIMVYRVLENTLRNLLWSTGTEYPRFHAAPSADEIRRRALASWPACLAFTRK
jgi:L-seryl-tRNA(Ser) seleniumtransferase